jgi:hypothetical protein
MSNNGGAVTWAEADHKLGTVFSIYLCYASNVPAGITTVTATLSGGTPVATGNITAEIWGLATSSALDQHTNGTVSSASSWSVGPTSSTAVANEYESCIVAANGSGNPISGVGGGFTTEVSSSNAHMYYLDQVVSSTGAITCSGNFAGSVAEGDIVIGSFKVGAGGPFLTGISPSLLNIGDSFTVTGSGFGASQGGSTISVNGISAVVTAWSAISITATMPQASNPLVAKVTVSGVNSNPKTTYTYAVTAVLPKYLMATTINSANMPGLFASPVTKTVKSSGGDYTTLQAAVNAIGSDAPNCNEIITVDAGYTAGTFGGGGHLIYHYTCPSGAYVWIRSSGYASLPAQGQTVCTTTISSVSENAGQTVATFTTSRNHLLSTNALVRIKGVTDTNFNGDYSITVTGANTFTVPNTIAGSNASSSGGTMIPVSLYLAPANCPDISNMFVIAKTAGSSGDDAIQIRDEPQSGSTASSGLIITGMYVKVTTGAEMFVGMYVGSNGTTTDLNFVNHVIIDRAYFPIPSSTNIGYIVEMQGPWNALVDSYIDGAKDLSGDFSEDYDLWLVWAPGPYKIVDNYIGGIATQCAFFGGDNIHSPGQPLASDIEYRTNTCFKDFTNRANTISAKNDIESKAALRVLIDGNTFEYSWNSNTGSNQFGAMMVFYPQNPNVTDTWVTNQDFTVSNNDMQHFGTEMFAVSGIATSANHSNVYSNRLTFSNDLARDINTVTYDTGLGGNLQANLMIQRGATGTQAPDNLIMNHTAAYGSVSNGGFYAYTDMLGCGIIGHIPDWQYHANTTLLDNEWIGDCQSTYDGFFNAGIFINPLYTGNVHVGYTAGDFSTAGVGNAFPAGTAASPPAGMFNNYSVCNGVPSGPINACALQSGSTYHNSANCDNADCGPNLVTLNTAQVLGNDTTSFGPRLTDFPAVGTSIPAGVTIKGVTIH